jgi:phosphoribosyl 1,2-cyclic phosphate phosphodiesterase
MKASLTVLGSGTSMGVPSIGCNCAVCCSSDPRDKRTRPSILLKFGGHVVLVDTTPDFRTQALREGISQIDAVLYTHAHADHVLGLDDLRPLSFRHKGNIPLYAREDAAALIKAMFSYIFERTYKFGGLAEVELHIIHGPLDLFGACLEPVKVMHGETEIFGYRFGTAAYLTDFSSIPEASFPQLHNLDVLFLDALRRTPHPTHSTIDNSLQIVERLKPKRAFFTHISHDLAHEATNATLPDNVRLCYDGQQLEFEM